MYASKTRKEKFSGPGENCQRNVTDLAGSLVTSSRPPGPQQRRPDDRTSNAGVAVRTADGSRRTADAGDEQCLRCGGSAEYCDERVCLSLCVFVCPRSYLRNYKPDLHKIFLYMLPMAVARSSSDGVVICYVFLAVRAY